jgi:hypothetical protein
VLFRELKSLSNSSNEENPPNSPDFANSLAFGWRGIGMWDI